MVFCDFCKQVQSWCLDACMDKDPTVVIRIGDSVHIRSCREHLEDEDSLKLWKMIVSDFKKNKDDE
jgi:hypothetical protein